MNEAAVSESSIKVSIGASLGSIERDVILATLRQQGNSRNKTARVLGIGIRTLQRKLKTYNVPRGKGEPHTEL